MTWILNRKTAATRSMDPTDVNYTYFSSGMEFPTVEDTVDPKVKKVTTGTGAVFYVPSANIDQQA